MSSPSYVTFHDPTPESGVYAFARIAETLGRLRPDVPLLVVEDRGTEADLAACGLDLQAIGNVHLMAASDGPERYWGVSRLALMPWADWDHPVGSARNALQHGVPVVGSDRGALPELLGGAGRVLALPGWLTPASRRLPASEEVSLWVEAVLQLFDDPGLLAEHRRRSLFQASRNSEKPRSSPRTNGWRPDRSVVLVPHLHGIEWECEQSLRGLERAGVRVVRRGGSSAIDLARNILASEALMDGFESLLFIDADIGFDPTDALRLLARPEPVLAGVYVKKGSRSLASLLAEGVAEVHFGDQGGLYPLKYAVAGFLRIRTDVLRLMAETLKLPLCNTRRGRGFWPFFQPMIVSGDPDHLHYLAEDWLFSHRLAELGVTPLADTAIRLWHIGRHRFSWEDAGSAQPRYQSYLYRPGPAPDL